MFNIELNYLSFILSVSTRIYLFIYGKTYIFTYRKIIPAESLFFYQLIMMSVEIQFIILPSVCNALMLPIQIQLLNYLTYDDFIRGILK